MADSTNASALRETAAAAAAAAAAGTSQCDATEIILHRLLNFVFDVQALPHSSS
jgi:hypothetical protein